MPLSNDNYQVTVDTDKQQMKISKRGQATIAMKATNLPNAMNSTRRNPHHSIQSPNSASNGAETLQTEGVGKEMISDVDSTQFQLAAQSTYGGRSQASISHLHASHNLNTQAPSDCGVTAVTSAGQGGDDPNHSYYVFSSKLVKFRDTKLRAIKFT